MNGLQRSLAALRAFTAPRPAVERCGLCGHHLSTAHPHLLESGTSRLVCACLACNLLFDGQADARYRRVPARVRRLREDALSDAAWESLALPINLAFFCFRSAAERVVAWYPSPAGAMESHLDLEAWTDLIRGQPALASMEPDVEALLVHRVGDRRLHYAVGIDRCFELVGLVRSHWHGLSGGDNVWQQVDRYFAGLERLAHG